MDAQLKQLQIKPATFDKESLMVNHEYASITLNVPLDSASQREAVVELLDLLNKEWCVIEIDGKQSKMDLQESTSLNDDDGDEGIGDVEDETDRMAELMEQNRI